MCGRRYDEIWNRLPFRNLKLPKILPDGNIIICRWEDQYLDWPIYHSAKYDQFFKPQRGDVVVDAGAHIGEYTLKAAKEVGETGRVISVEPDDKNYELLVKNVRINRYQNVTPIKLALSDFGGKAKLFLQEKSDAHSLIKNLWEAPVGITEVAVTTLDKLVERLAIKKVDVLKINAEGSELNILRGSKKLLTKGRISNIVVTTHPPHKQGANEIKRYLQTFGYTVKASRDAKMLYKILYACVRN